MAIIAYNVFDIQKPQIYSDIHKKGEWGKFFKECQQVNIEAPKELQNLRFATPARWLEAGIKGSSKLGWTVVRKQDICTLPKTTPQILTNCKGKMCFYSRKIWQCLISNTETAGHSTLGNSQHHPPRSLGKNVCYGLNVCVSQNSCIKILTPNGLVTRWWRLGDAIRSGG